MDSKRVVNEIVKAFRKLDEYHGKHPKRRPRSKPGWTKVVFETLSGLNKMKKCDVRHKRYIGTPPGKGEWLWDLCWRKEDGSGSLVEVPLAVECEWGIGVDVKEDFERLMAARASVRVMIYDARRRGKHAAESIAKGLCDCVGKFHGRRGDVYLLIAAEGNDKHWKYFRITDRGMRHPPKLEQTIGPSTKRVSWNGLA